MLTLHVLSPSAIEADPVIEAYSGERPADADEVDARHWREGTPHGRLSINVSDPNTPRIFIKELGRDRNLTVERKPYSSYRVMKQNAATSLLYLAGEVDGNSTKESPRVPKAVPVASKPASWPVYLFAGLAIASGAAAIVARDEEDLFPAALVGAAGFSLITVGVYFDIRARELRATMSLSPNATVGPASRGWNY